jgi:hypothetical protein
MTDSKRGCRGNGLSLPAAMDGRISAWTRDFNNAVRGQVLQNIPVGQFRHPWRWVGTRPTPTNALRIKGKDVMKRQHKPHESA